MVTENMQAEIADLEAELEEACRGPLDFEEKGRYSWPVALKVARRLLEIVRCTAPLAATGEAVEGMPAGYALHHYDDASWLVRESNLSGWEKLPFPPTVTGAMKKAAEEYSYDPTWDAALRAAKGHGDA